MQPRAGTSTLSISQRIRDHPNKPDPGEEAARCPVTSRMDGRPLSPEGAPFHRWLLKSMSRLSRLHPKNDAVLLEPPSGLGA